MPENKTILVAEDEEPLRKALVESLKAERFHVLEAKNGQEALKIALKEHPNLILLDVLMPKLDGKGVLEGLAKDSWGETAMVILLTNLSDPIKMAELAESGAKNISVFDYLIKSDWKLEDVITKVKEKLGLK